MIKSDIIKLRKSCIGDKWIRKKILLISVVLVLTIVAVIVGILVVKNDKDNNRVKEYKVIDNNLESNYVSLEIAKSIDVSSFMKELVKLSNDEKELTFTLLKKYSSMNDVLNIIKDYDSDFSESNYKIKYNLPYDDKSSGVVFITYYIVDSKTALASSSSTIQNIQIETNKAYMLTIDSAKIDSISLAGVKKDNLDTIKSIDNKKLIQIVNNFKGIEKEKALLEKDKQNIFKSGDILNNDNTIKKSALPDDVISYNESFSFDYNTQKLKYRFLSTVEFGEGYYIEIDLN